MRTKRLFSSSIVASLLVSMVNFPAESAGLGGFFPISPPFVGAMTITRPSPDASEQARFVRRYDQIWQLVQNHFLYRNRLKNWTRWRHRFDTELVSQESLQNSVDTMLGSLNDPYTYYRDTQATSMRNEQDVETNVVDYKMINRRIGYIKLKTFSSKNCVGEMRNGMQQLSGASAIVMDLRDNKGGSVDDAFRIFSMFVKSGRFASVTGFDKKSVVKEKLTVSKTKLVDTVSKTKVIVPKQAKIANKPNQPKTKVGTKVSSQKRERNLSKARPLYVLVDGQTRSAAEMLAGALRDSAGAKLIGTRTYGKGVIQRVWEFEDNTSVKITSAAYHLPSGATVHGVGIKPTIKIVSSSADKQLQLAARLVKSQNSSAKTKIMQSQPVVQSQNSSGKTVSISSQPAVQSQNSSGKNRKHAAPPAVHKIAKERV